jgi:transglutaminase-like putative cysteine protease
MSRRAIVGGAIIAAWLGGVALLVRREYFRPRAERLAEAAARVAPAAVYYGVMQGERQVGFASSQLDTALNSISVNDYFVVDVPVGGKPRRTTARTSVTLSRALRMTQFDLSLETEGAPIHAAGRVDRDTSLVIEIASGGGQPEVHRVPIEGPVLLPTIVPLVVALAERPKVGSHIVLPVLDPASMTPKDVGFDVRAESLFVLDDSSVYDAMTKRWHGARPDTVRAWQVTASTPGNFSGWVDDQGRIDQTSQLGFELRRLPYEVAFENWRADTAQAEVTEDRDVLESTAIAADKRMDQTIDRLSVRLSNVSLAGFDLTGPRQLLSGDTLRISREPDAALAARYRLFARRNDSTRLRDTAFTNPEPLIQSRDVRIRALAIEIIRRERDPRKAAELLNAWVHDSIKPRVTFGVPSAIQVLKDRTGDCNEHTQLFVALARAVGIPARVAAGLAYLDGKFYYHAWPEILLNDWVAVDPTFGQFPADAAHLRFVVGGLARQTELLRLMGNLKIDVLSVNGASRAPGTHR